MNTFITMLTAQCYWNLFPARRIHSQCHTSYADNGSLGSSTWQILRSAQSKGSKICTAATNTFNNQLLIEDRKCQAMMRVKGGECKALLSTNVQMAHGTCRSRSGCRMDSAASFRKVDSPGGTRCQGFHTQVGPQVVEGFSSKEPCQKGAHQRCLQNGCPVQADFLAVIKTQRQVGLLIKCLKVQGICSAIFSARCRRQRKTRVETKEAQRHVNSYNGEEEQQLQRYSSLHNRMSYTAVQRSY